MYLGKKVSIVFPVYNEKENIRKAIEDFLREPTVDEVVAVDNNSTDGSDKEIKLTSAKYVKEMTQGYGAALRRGMSEATGDLIITCEPDGTFRASDLDRLLVYSQSYDVVLGTRTSRNPVWSGGDPGANMDFALRMGNWFVAKMLEYLFNGPSFTDVGCTYKLIHRLAYEKIKKSFTVNGNWFSPEYMMRVLQHKLAVVEIPVHYGARIGTSKITGKRMKAIMLGFKMIRFILRERLKSWVRPAAPVVAMLAVTLALTAVPFFYRQAVVGEKWQGIQPAFTDETLYLARVQTLVKGDLSGGNPFFLEHRDDKPLVIFGGAWLNAIPQFLGFSLLTAQFLNFIFWSLIIVLLLFSLCRELRSPPWLSIFGTLFIYIESYQHIWRAVNLQTVFPFLILFYLALVRTMKKPSRLNTIVLTLTIGASFYIFAYLWQVVMTTIGLFFIWTLLRKNWSLAKNLFLSTLVGGILGSPVVVKMLSLSKSSPYFWESLERLGLVRTHLPMAEIIYSGGWVVLVLIFIFFLFWRVKVWRTDRSFQILSLFFVISGLGLWIMQGSNLVTGQLLETGEHLRLFIMPWLVLATIAITSFLWQKSTDLSRSLKVLSLLTIVILGLANLSFLYHHVQPVLYSNLDREAWLTQQLYAGPFTWLDQNEDEPVAIWSDPHHFLALALPVFTKHYSLYTFFGTLNLMSNEEVYERYLVSQYFNSPTSADLQTGAEMELFLGRADLAHKAKTLERKIKICRRFFLWREIKECGEAPTPQGLLGQEFFNDLETKLKKEIQPNIKTYLAKYHIGYILKDKVLDQKYRPEVLGAVKVYENERFELYRLPK